jgi:prepilin signal peptidase PulO-like enzyme (type II secretory pathway)
VTPLAAAVATAGTLAGGIADARTGYIPNAITASAFAAASIAAVAGGAAGEAWRGALLAGGSLLALHAVTRGRGIGLGDVKLAAVAGAGIGTSGALVALASAFAAGGAVAVWLLATHRAQRGDAIRFGPFIAAGTVVAVALEALR